MTHLRLHPRNWLVTGAAGFIGGHLVQYLLRHGQSVVGLDNFATGRRENLTSIREHVGESAWSRFKMLEADIRDLDDCRQAVTGADYVLHQAALGSVPRSIADPITTNTVNVDGFVNMLVASRDAGVQRFVYASSSAVYGDHPALPKREMAVGRPLSPYAITKATNEAYAEVFARQYRMSIVGLRYFNVFGPRQDPNGEYAAVVPRWIQAMMAGQPCTINGDGETSRDFCFVDNAVQANILSASTDTQPSVAAVFNVACAERTSLNELHSSLADAIGERGVRVAPPIRQTFRAGDVRHSLADISAISEALGYEPSHRVGAGIPLTVNWFAERAGLELAPIGAP